MRCEYCKFAKWAEVDDYFNYLCTRPAAAEKKPRKERDEGCLWGELSDYYKQNRNRIKKRFWKIRVRKPLWLQKLRHWKRKRAWDHRIAMEKKKQIKNAKILRKRKKKEVCPYCLGKNQKVLTEEKAFEWTSETEKIVFTKNGAAIETGDARRIPIEFCPKCGRDLISIIGEEE